MCHNCLENDTKKENKTKKKYLCEGCETKHYFDSIITVEHNGEILCEDCYIELYNECDACGCAHANEESNYYRDLPYCESCFYEYHFYCSSCDEACLLDNNEHYHSDDNPDYYCDECYSYTIPRTIDNMSLPSYTVHSSSEEFSKYNIRRFVGLEIECIIPSSEASEYIPAHWSRHSDSSISTGGDGYGIEMVSSPANGDRLLRLVDAFIKWRDDHNAYVNASCGFHVHFNSIDMSPREVSYVGIVYKKYQSLLKSMMPNSRQSSRWCKDFNLSFKRLQSIEDESDLIDLYYDNMGTSPSREKYNDARYCALNLHARYYHGTMEFRLHSGTINREKILNWISILNTIIEKGIQLSKEKSVLKVKEWIEQDDGENISLDMFGDKIKEYINKRKRKFYNERS